MTRKRRLRPFEGLEGRLCSVVGSFMMRGMRMRMRMRMLIDDKQWRGGEECGGVYGVIYR